MPKKTAKNAFYFFMLHFREEQKKKGITYANMGEVQQAADPVWRELSPAQRGKFEDLARKEKEKYNIPSKKYTSQGVPLSEIERQQRLMKEAKETEVRDIESFVKLNCFCNDIQNQFIYIIDVNSYCRTSSHFLIAEVTVLRFSLKNGVEDYYHEPDEDKPEQFLSKIPIGYASDVKLGSAELGLKMPDDETPRADYLAILANLIDYLKLQDKNAKVLPPLYTVPEKVEQVQDFILQMCRRAGEDETLFRVYQLDTLFYYLVNNIKKRDDEGLPKMTLSTDLLKKDPFKYTFDLSCSRHEVGKDVECTLSRARRWAYSTLDTACPLLNIELLPGSHLPHGLDVETVIQNKEMRREAINPNLAQNVGEASSNSSVVEREGSVASSSNPKKEKRSHKPVRLPRSDLSENFRIPEVTSEAHDTEFPPLMVGHGRGRLTNSFNQLRLDV